MNIQYQNRNEEFFKLSTGVFDYGLNAAASAAAMTKTINDKEQEFHDYIREVIVCVFIYCFLYALAYFAIKLLRQPKVCEFLFFHFSQ
jgi:hypothetical protein